MRTIGDLPKSLMRAAKAKGATAGEPLKALFERAIAREVGSPLGAERQGEVEYPLVRSQRLGVDFTNEHLEEMLAADEADRYAR